MVGLSIVGAILFFSPIPYWDMWNGYLDFFFKVQNGDHLIWWAQHNEHRIVLSRLLFWIDLYFFRGSIEFLLTINYLLVATSAYLFYKFFCEINKVSKVLVQFKIILTFIVVWLFLWIQNENLIWGFQSQFFLAQILPLAAMYFLGKSSVGVNTRLNLLVACFFGLISIGTMANGILMLPLMAVYAIAVIKKPSHIVFLGILAILAPCVYLHNYFSPAGHGSLIATISNKPFELLLYSSLYLGSPIFHLFEPAKATRFLAIFCGSMFILGMLYVGIRALKGGAQKKIELALIFFMVYVVLTSLVTGGGRLIFGVDQALSGRYTTPALMAWASLAVVFSPLIIAWGQRNYKKFLLSSCIIFVGMIPSQLKVFKGRDAIVFEQKVAALAVSLQANDVNQIKNIFPDSKYALEIGKKSSDLGLSVFRQHGYEAIGKSKSLGVSIEKIQNNCRGSIDGVEELADEPEYLKISGWFLNANGKSVPPVLNFLNTQNTIVGRALTGSWRGDVAKAYGQNYKLSGFKGYIPRRYLGELIAMNADGGECGILTFLPPPKEAAGGTLLPLKDVVTVNSLINTGNWLGQDYQRTVDKNFIVYGSYIQSDADKGSISIKYGRGQKLFYKSGPFGGGQYLKTQSEKSIVLPVATEWTALNLSNILLNKIEETIVIIDDGADFGEWSAVALRNSGK